MPSATTTPSGVASRRSTSRPGTAGGNGIKPEAPGARRPSAPRPRSRFARDPVSVAVEIRGDRLRCSESPLPRHRHSQDRADSVECTHPCSSDRIWSRPCLRRSPPSHRRLDKTPRDRGRGRGPVSAPSGTPRRLHIGRVSCDLSEPAGHEGAVEQVAVYPHVRERPSIAIGPLDIELQTDRLALQRSRGEGGGRGAKALYRSRWMHGFGHVDTDQSDRFYAPAETDLDGVAVDGTGDVRGFTFFPGLPPGASFPLAPEPVSREPSLALDSEDSA